MPLRNNIFSGLLLIMLAACGSNEGYSPKGGTQDPTGIKIGKPYKIKGIRYYPEYDPTYLEEGLASWYGPGFHGRMTASGEEYDQYEMTAAHKTLPMPSIVRVIHRNTGKSIIVRINDRGPFAPGRIIDLSKKAAQTLGTIGEGVAPVKVEYLPVETERYLVDVGIAVPEKWRTGRQYAENIASPQPEPPIVAVQRNDYAPEANGNTVRATDLAPPLQQNYYVPPPIKLQPRTPAVDASLRPLPETTTIRIPETAYVEDAFSVIDEAAPIIQPRSTYQPAPIRPAAMPKVPVTSARTASASSVRYFVQVATFGIKTNAERLADKLAPYATPNILPMHTAARTLYKVRMGPINSPAVADNLRMRAISLGHKDTHLVVE